MNKINRRNWYYDAGIFFECYVMDDFGNLVLVDNAARAFSKAA